MARPLPTLSIIGGVLAALSALMFADPLPLLLAPVAITGAVFLFLLRDRSGMLLGVVALALAIVGILGMLGNVSFKEEGVDFGISAAVGHAALIAAVFLPAADIVWRAWGDKQTWQSSVEAGVVFLAMVLPFGMRGDLVDQGAAGAFVVALFALLTMAPGIMSLRQS